MMRVISDNPNDERSKMNITINRASLVLLQTLLLLFTTATISSAQTGNQQDKPFYPVTGPTTEKKEMAPAKAPSSIAQRFEKQGVRIDFSLKSTPDGNGKDAGLVAGANAVATFNVTDARTGQPLVGLHPNAWINTRVGERVPNEAECKDMVRTFLGGLLSARADVDLNNYLLLTLNHDDTVAFINPQISFNVTKLESIVTLPGHGADWVLSKNKDFLYVTLPQQSSVAIINTITRKLVGTIPTGDKTQPTRIALQPDGRYVWVGLDDSSSVVAIDTATNKPAGTITVGAGLHNIAFTGDSRFAYVSNSAADTVSAIDTKKLARVSDISVGKTPVPVAFSAASNFIYVTSINGATISVIDPSRQQVIKTIPTARGIVAFRFDPEGRYGFAVNQVESKVSVIDAATNTIVATTDVVKSPDQVTFTSGYAYIRGTGTEKFSLIKTGDIRTQKLAPIDIQAGRRAASDAPEDLGVADMIAATPEGNSVMIANAPDQMIYYYVEGMMAPMGTLDNYKRRAHALMLIDRSLSEVAPGVYSAPIRLAKGGRFDVPFLLDQPRTLNCFQAEIGDSPDGEKHKPAASLIIEPLFKGQTFKQGETATLRFKITDEATKKPMTGLQDLHVLVFEPPGIWQQRQWAKEVGDGVYEVTQTFPRAGGYRVMTSIMSRGIRFADLPFVPASVVAETSPAGKTVGEKISNQ
jgi:YVTN family beta-propeller protein